MKEMEKVKFILCSSSTRAPRIERKISEKNRRNRLKILYSNLFSLLPNHGLKQAMPLSDQIDEVVTYIESLKMKLEKMKEKRVSLLPRKISNSCIITNEIQANTQSPPPLVEVQDMGPNMDVILVTGLDHFSMFYNILHLLHEDSIEVVNATFSVHGNSSFQIVHDKILKSSMGFGATTMKRRINDLIRGYACSEVESNYDLWDYEIQTDNWEFNAAEVTNAYSSFVYC
ncbi:transcription factor bHLH162-like [Olea europaea subsp. europaea]|uniref:Transcription factor bHLH162-like n=1 Tax=Olea europaea subsp. europaea TaxID=158383 RepID=A0A8S0TRD4_OLEEU|nr:transcription factor bHLH162-like [Olea europaea subsp. europaea]